MNDTGHDDNVNRAAHLSDGLLCRQSRPLAKLYSAPYAPFSYLSRIN